jgi:hypothetical protein
MSPGNRLLGGGARRLEDPDILGKSSPPGSINRSTDEAQEADGLFTVGSTRRMGGDRAKAKTSIDRADRNGIPRLMPIREGQASRPDTGGTPMLLQVGLSFAVGAWKRAPDVAR